MNELISIIVPAYNVENELGRCISSLLNQTYKNIEIIIVNDGSIDNTGLIADSLKNDNPNRIKVIHQVNKGLSGARNTGINVAKGEYISFIDSDDFVSSNMLYEMIFAMQSTQSDIAVCGRIDEYSNRSLERFCMNSMTTLSPEETMKRILLWDKLDIAAWDKLYKRSLWNEVRFPEGFNNEDICTIPLIVRKTDKVVHVGKAFYHYCHRKNSITTSYNEKKIKDFYHAIGKMNQYVSVLYRNIYDELVYYNNRSYMNLLMMCEEINYFGEERNVAKEYLKNNWKTIFSLNHMSKYDKVLKKILDFHLFLPIKRIKHFFDRNNLGAVNEEIN